MSVCLEVDFAKLFYSQLCSSFIGPRKKFSMPDVLDYFMVRWLDHYGYEYEYFGDTSNFFVFCEKHRKTEKKGRALLNPENDDCKFFLKKKPSIHERRQNMNWHVTIFLSRYARR